MCIISVIPQGSELPAVENLQACWDRNDDGGGLMIVNPENQLEIHKEMDEDLFLQLVKEKHAAYGEQSPTVLHFRVGTHGGVQLPNNHPFIVHDNVAMMHNGVLPGFGDRGWGRSDSREFAEDVLRELQPDFHMNIAIRELIVETLGTDKMVFLDNQRRVVILNRGLGEMEGEVWYSNSGYKPFVSRFSQRGRDVSVLTSAFHVACHWCYTPIDSFWNQREQAHMLPHWVDENYPLCRTCDNTPDAVESVKKSKEETQKRRSTFKCYCCDTLFDESDCSFAQYVFDGNLKWVCDNCTGIATEQDITVAELKAYMVNFGGNT